MLNEQNVPVITLDGPSGTGKGSLGFKLAKHLGWHFLDSGAIYRALALALAKRGIDLVETESLVKLAHTLQLRFDMDEKGRDYVFLDGLDVGNEIRSEQVGQDASKIAALSDVRQALLERQHAFAKPPGLVADGRDMGTVVFPNAILKIYLDATLEERAKRRYLQLKEKKNNVSFQAVQDELAKRDARDRARAHSPLAQAADAILIDTTGLTIVQVFENILQLLREKGIE